MCEVRGVKNNFSPYGKPVSFIRKTFFATALQCTFFFFIYLAVSGLSCGTWDIRCRLRDPCCGTWDLLVAACGIFSCGMGNLVPWPGVEPGPPALGAWSLSHWTTREVPRWYMLLFLIKWLLYMSRYICGLVSCPFFHHWSVCLCLIPHCLSYCSIIISLWWHKLCS